MAGGADAEDQTEAPSARRLEQARASGQVALSREAVGCAALAGATLAAALTLPAMSGRLLAASAELFAASHSAILAEATLGMARQALLLVLPVALGAAAGATAATLLQTGFLLRLEALLPQASRINPLAALKRMFGKDGLVELLRSLLKLALIGAALRQAIDPRALQAALHDSAIGLTRTLGEAALRLLLAALAAAAVLAGADYAWVRFRHMRQLRMSREELRQESRDSDGDPLIRARMRRLREQRARQRMLAAVPKAAVVITNPTHYAVALAYQEGQAAAPTLLAKGLDEMAARIRAAAEEHGVPIVANPPLARALFKLPADAEVPAEHWAAVAEILAYVWRLRQRVAGGSRA